MTRLQGDIFSDLGTSLDAARAIRPHKDSQRARVLALIASAGANGMTAQEIAERSGMSGDSVRPRLVELRESGAVVATGEVRLTDSGRAARAWRLA